MTESWWLKLQRADRHLKEVDDHLRPYDSKQVYRPQLVTRTKAKENDWRYLLEVTEPLDEMLPIIIGDAVHNMRSALDHILVAMRPQKYKRNAGFPIFLDDPWTGEQTERKTRDVAIFENATASLSHEAIDAIKRFQPYLDQEEGSDPKRNALGVITRLDNADKHRDPIVVIPGLIKVHTVVTVRDELPLEQEPPPHPNGFPQFAAAGTELAHFRWIKLPALEETEVDVNLSGTPQIAMQVGLDDGYMEVRDTLARSLGYLWEHVIPVMEQFLPNRG